MKKKPKIPLPVTYNPYKHHFSFLMECISYWQKMDWQEVDKDLKLIGNNMLDLYLGNLSVENVCQQSIRFFLNNELLDKERYLNWLVPAGYRKIELADQSLWIIKKGDYASRYIHIHPAKNSLHTIRVRAATLKTVLALRIKDEKLRKDINRNLEAVNRIRMEYLELSPVKKLEPGKGIVRLWHLFNLP